MPRCNAMTGKGSRCKLQATIQTKCFKHTKTTCAICMEEVSSQNTATSKRLTCNHSFHLDCILNWYKQASVCPICRKEQNDDLFVIFKEGIKDEMREIYSDAIKSLQQEVEEYRLRF